MTDALEKSELHLKQLHKLESLENLITITSSKIAALERKQDVDLKMKECELARLSEVKEILTKRQASYREEIRHAESSPDLSLADSILL